MLTIENLHFSYPNTTEPILRGFDLSVGNGETVAVMGPSGCGKSTLLHLIAGLYRPTAGTVTYDGTLSYVFQEARLFPWLSVCENVALVLPKSAQNRDEIIKNALTGVDLADCLSMMPGELSGGMKMRVSIARAVASLLSHGGKGVLLLDEPFAALDSELRTKLADDVKTLTVKNSFSTLFVTHNREDAERIADRIVEM